MEDAELSPEMAVLVDAILDAEENAALCLLAMARALECQLPNRFTFLADVISLIGHSSAELQQDGRKTRLLERFSQLLQARLVAGPEKPQAVHTPYEPPQRQGPK